MKIHRLFFGLMICMSMQVIAQMDPEGIFAAAKRDDVEHLKKVFARNSAFKKLYGLTLADKAMNYSSMGVVEFLKEQGVEVDKVLKRHEIFEVTLLSDEQFREQACAYLERESQKRYGQFKVIYMSDDQDAE